MKHRKILRLLSQFFCGTVAFYLLIYAILSLNGSYQVVESDLNHADYGWIPCGFYPPKHKQPTWINYALFDIYLPLWELDENYVHKNPPPSVWFHDKK